MKAFRTIFFILVFFYGFQVLADISSSQNDKMILIAKEVDNLALKSKQEQQNPRVIIQIRTELEGYQTQAKKCSLEAQKKIELLKDEEKIIKTPTFNSYLENQKKQSEHFFQIYQEQLDLCNLISFRINLLIKAIDNFNQINYVNSFSKKYPNFLENLQSLNFSKFVMPPQGYILNTFLPRSNALMYARILLIILGAIIFIKLMNYFEMIKTINFQSISIRRYVYMSIIFMCISPVQYLLLKIGYSRHDDILLSIYKKPNNYLISISVFVYLYYFYNENHFKKDIFFMIFSLIFEIFLIAFSVSLYYFDLNNISNTETLFCRYLIIFNLLGVCIYIYYWLFYRIMNFGSEQSPYSIIYFILISILLIFGLKGYVDMSINLYFSLVFFCIIYVFLVLFTRVKKMIINALISPGPKLQKYLKAFFENDEDKAIWNMKFLIHFVYITVTTQVIMVSFISLAWFFLKDIVFDIYDLVYTEQSIGSFHFIVINYLFAFVTFLTLNILNYGVANYLAKKIFVQPAARVKMTQFFYILGIFLIFSVALKIAKVDLQNFIYLVGGLFLGIGLGLKNIITNIISSVMIFANRPFEVGDFVCIGTTKAYVKKIGILETVFETLDKDAVILPNQYIASTPIENFTYGNKNTHRIHLIYLMDNFDIKNEQKIQEVVLKIFQKSQFISEHKKHPPKFIFSPSIQPLNNFKLEIIFNVNTLHHLNENLSNLNLQIIAALHQKKIELQFNGLYHPLLNN